MDPKFIISAGKRSGTQQLRQAVNGISSSLHAEKRIVTAVSRRRILNTRDNDCIASNFLKYFNKSNFTDENNSFAFRKDRS